MQNLWNEDEAQNISTDINKDLALRVYSSRLLGQDNGS